MSYLDLWAWSSEPLYRWKRRCRELDVLRQLCPVLQGAESSCSAMSRTDILWELQRDLPEPRAPGVVWRLLWKVFGHSCEPAGDRAGEAGIWRWVHTLAPPSEVLLGGGPGSFPNPNTFLQLLRCLWSSSFPKASAGDQTEGASNRGTSHSWRKRPAPFQSCGSCFCSQGYLFLNPFTPPREYNKSEINGCNLGRP